MKKLFAIAIVTLALGACGGKAKNDGTMENTGGAMGTAVDAAPANPCAGNPCNPAPNPCNPCNPK